MAKEHHLYGPPGCGKTTWIRRQAIRAVEEGFYDPGDLLFCSFTRAAAHTLVGRDMPIRDRRQIGTLHSLCYHALGRPEIAETYISSSNKEHIKPWNEWCPRHLRMSAGKTTVDEMAVDGRGQSEGDKIFAEIERYRALRIDPERWPIQAQHMYQQWRKWCDLNHVLGFTDLIEEGIKKIEVAPGEPRVGFFDECFPAGTLIITRNGNVPIEDVNVGDEILTHRGRWRPVTRTGNRLAETVTVRGYGHYGLSVTPDHPFFTKNDWVKAADLHGKRWASPTDFPQDSSVPEFQRENKKQRIPCEQNISFLWLVGRYLADGSVSSSFGKRDPENINRTWWSVATSKLSECEFHLRQAGAKYRVNTLTKTDQAVNIVVNSTVLAKWMATECGRGAKNKFLPAWALGLSDKERKAIWDGYRAGDGATVHTYSDNKPIEKITTASKSLALGTKLLAQSLGYVVRWYAWEQDSRKWYQVVAGTSDRYADRTEQHIFTNVKEVVPNSSLERVYNLSVSGDESYIADGIVVHNCQDFTPLQLQLVRRWGQDMDYFILAGDANQCIYSWLGADPGVFLESNIPEENKHRLRRSWRMSSAVHEAAGRWIATASEAEIFEFQANTEGGSVQKINAGFNTPDQAVRLAADLAEEGKSVMILGATSYLLDATKYALKDAALPFHNPMRRRRGDWNPLYGAGGVPSSVRLLSYLQPTESGYGLLWTGRDIKNWIPLIKATGVLRRGVWKEEVANLPDDELIQSWRMRKIFEPQALYQLCEEWGMLKEPRIDWLQERLQKSKKAALEYHFKIIKRRGIDALANDPNIILGTIHSVKGGEADVVILIPDLSPSGFRQWSQAGKARDAVIRQFYVGLSRARESVYIMQPGSGFFVTGLG